MKAIKIVVAVSGALCVATESRATIVPDVSLDDIAESEIAVEGTVSSIEYDSVPDPSDPDVSWPVTLVSLGEVQTLTDAAPTRLVLPGGLGPDGTLVMYGGVPKVAVGDRLLVSGQLWTDAETVRPHWGLGLLRELPNGQVESAQGRELSAFTADGMPVWSSTGCVNPDENSSPCEALGAEVGPSFAETKMLWSDMRAGTAWVQAETNQVEE